MHHLFKAENRKSSTLPGIKPGTSCMPAQCDIHSVTKVAFHFLSLSSQYLPLLFPSFFLYKIQHSLSPSLPIILTPSASSLFFQRDCQECSWSQSDPSLRSAQCFRGQSFHQIVTLVREKFASVTLKSSLFPLCSENEKLSPFILLLVLWDDTT